MPEEARADTQAGAVAFVRHFFAKVNASYATGQTGLLRPLTTTRCSACPSVEAGIAAALGPGRHTVSEPMLLREVTPSNEPRRVGETLVDVLFTLRPTKLVDASGAPAGALKEVRGIYLVSVVRDTAGWRVDGITLMQ